MFIFDTNTGKITMHAGNTGTVEYDIGGNTLGENDRVIWTMKNSRNEIVKQVVLTPVNNKVTVTFANADTDSLPAGTYQYDICVVTDPVYDTEDATKIVDGATVTTLSDAISIIIKSVIGLV